MPQSQGTNGVRVLLTHDPLLYGDDFRRIGEYVRQALKHLGIEDQFSIETKRSDRPVGPSAWIGSACPSRSFVSTTPAYPVSRQAGAVYPMGTPAGSVPVRVAASRVSVGKPACDQIPANLRVNRAPSSVHPAPVSGPAVEDWQ